MSPKLSLLVPIHAASREAKEALHGLSTHCQRNVADDDYEIIVVESPSADELGSSAAEACGKNVRYFLRDPSSSSPPSVLDFFFEQSRAPVIGVMDGVGIVTPRLIEHVLQSQRLSEYALAVVPAYDLGLPGSFAAPEDDFVAALLERVDWKSNAYELFEMARLRDTNPNGYLCSVLESEAFFFARSMFDTLRASGQLSELGTFDELFAKLASLAECRLVVLGGEGYFKTDRNPRFVAPERDIWQRFDRQPLLFGALPGQAQEFFRASIGHAAIHEALAREQGVAEWPHDQLEAIASPTALEEPQNITLSARAAPLISIVLVIFRIPRQAENTVYSLSARHQWNVREEDYEIIVVENRSAQMLGEERARQLGGNVRYLLRDEPGVSPAPSLNFGVSQARASTVGLMIDGARMATPRVVEHALLARKVHDRPIAVVPGYHLGPGRQHVTSRQGYDENTEQALLASVDWKHSGYRLFEIATFDEATKDGFLNPLLEGTCLFCPKACFDQIGGLDERFDLPGGGEVNHDLFERLCRVERTRYVMLWGEGTFHQYHGGVSSGSAEDREAKLEAFRRQYDAIRGHRYRTWEREPLLLGACSGRAYENLMKAAWLGRIRYGMVRAIGRPEWPND